VGSKPSEARKNFPEPVLPFIILAPKSVRNSKHMNSCKVSPHGAVWETLNVNFRTRCEPTYFPSGLDACHHGHTYVENYQIEL